MGGGNNFLAPKKVGKEGVFLPPRGKTPFFHPGKNTRFLGKFSQKVGGRFFFGGVFSPQKRGKEGPSKKVLNISLKKFKGLLGGF